LGSSDANGNLIGGPESGAIDPRIAPLSANGGPTPTHALLSDSPAIDAGDPSLVADIGHFDQRGEPYERAERGRADIGAYERQDLMATLPNMSSPIVQPVAVLTIDFTRPVTGFDVTDLRLSRNMDGNLLTGDALLSTTDNQRFVLSGLTNLADLPGYYTLTLIASGSGICSAACRRRGTREEAFYDTHGGSRADIFRAKLGPVAGALATTRESSLTSHELSGVVDLLLASSTRQQTEFVLGDPRRA
jgi:hypothetical protein